MTSASAHPALAPSGPGAEPPAPFRLLAGELEEHLLPHIGELAGEIVRAIRTEIPEYARPMDDRYMHVVHMGVEQALHGFVARIVRSDTDWESVKGTYQRIGRGEADEGRSLDSFQSALRLGARVAWRQVNRLVADGRLPQGVLAAFGEAVLLHLDEMAAATSTGYTEARMHAAGELQMRRGRLLDLLVADPPVTAEVIGDLAQAAQWRVPARIAVVVTGPLPRRGQARPIVPEDFLARFDEQPGRIVVPDPDGPGRARAIAGALRRIPAAIGPTVPLDEGARSLRWASDALELARRGVLPDDGLIRCADHLTTLMLFRDEALVDALAARRLAPLDAFRAPQRDRLAETLLCWLRSGHNASEVAARLAVHPQTVRYRLRQLDEVFGDLLHDELAQFEMQLALHARSLRPRDE